MAGESCEARSSGAACRLRYWWPTAMLAWSWFMLWSTSFPGSSRWLGWARDPLSIAYFGMNFPEAAIGNGLLGFLIGASGVVQGVTASAAVWLMWFATIRVWEKIAGQKAEASGLTHAFRRESPHDSDNSRAAR